MMSSLSRGPTQHYHLTTYLTAQLDLVLNMFYINSFERSMYAFYWWTCDENSAKPNQSFRFKNVNQVN